MQESRKLITRAPRTDKASPVGSGRREASWSTRFEEVQRYLQDAGHLPTNSGGRDPRGDRLADWLRYQRRRRLRDLMSDGEATFLASIPGFEWLPRDVSWSHRVVAYEQFLTTHGRHPRVRGNRFERQLARWWSKNYRKQRWPERQEDLRALLRLGVGLNRSTADGR